MPNLWKNDVTCPVPKNNKPVALNDYRPIALTPIVMKCFERIILKRILYFTTSYHDPHQFAIKPNRSTDDATPGSFVRILFINLSSTFSTIQPHLMALKLLSCNVNPKLILWIIGFLVKRTQAVRFQRALWSSKPTSTGSPQGTVLSPVLFTLYTNDCSGSNTTPLMKYSDDYSLEDASNSDAVYFDAVKTFSSWCKINYLDNNFMKTKEMLIDFRKNPSTVPDLFIDGVKVERVSEYKYLGTVLDDNLSITINTDLIIKKCQSRSFFLQKLRSLQVYVKVLQGFIVAL